MRDVRREEREKACFVNRSSHPNHSQPTQQVQQGDTDMTITDNPMRNGVDTATLFATLDAVRATPQIATFQFRATNRWISGTHNQSTLHGFYGAMQEMEHQQPFIFDADHPAVLVGARRRPDAGRVPAPRAGRLPDRGHRQHRRRPRREPRLGRVDRRGRHRPLRHPRPVGRRPQRLRADPHQLHARGDDPEKLAQGRRAVPPRSAVFDVLTNGVPVAISVDAG